MVTKQADGTRRVVENLLFGCAVAEPDERLLILEEPPELGHYDSDLAPAVAHAAEGLGLHVARHDIGFAPEPGDLPDAALARMAAADHILFLARLGDQMRFRRLPHAENAIVSYAVTLPSLAGPFGTVPHGAMQALKAAINAAMASAGEIRVSCPLGTALRGRIPPSDAPMADVGIRRFPMCVFAPVPMDGFAGRIALARFLVGTGSIYYHPFLHAFDGVVMVHVQGTRVTGHDGPADVVARASAPMSPRWPPVMGWMAISSTPGMPGFTRAAAMKGAPRTIPAAGPAAPSATRGCCMSIPAAPTPRAR